MPSNWAKVIGQGRAKQILRTALQQGRIPHAYLLHGSSGIGKDALAIELAKTLLCRTQSDNACGECPSCKKMETLQHPNLRIIFPLPGTDTDKGEDNGTMDNDLVNEIRQQIAEKALNPYFKIEIPRAKFILIRSVRELKKESSLSNAEKGKKVFLIFEADAMNDASANALLKILEEPLDGIHFILTTSRKEALKQTIISRCQSVQCSLLNDEEIAGALVARNQCDETSARFISRLSGGSYARAVELLSEDSTRYRKEAVQFLRSVLGSSSVKLFDEQEEYFTGNKREQAEQLLTMLMSWFRDTIIAREGSFGNVLNLDQETELRSFIGKFGTKNLEACLSAVERALELLRRNVYLPLVMLSFSVQLRKILHAKEV